MANIVFGEYKPTEREELDFSDPNILDIEWLDENKKPVEAKIINKTDFSDIIYGQKVRVKIKFKDYIDNRLVFINIESNNKKCKFKPNIHTMWVKDNEVLSEPFVLPVNMYFDEIEEYDDKNHCTKVSNPQELYITVLNTTTFKTEKRHILKPYTYCRNYEELMGLHLENEIDKKTNEYKPNKDPLKTIQNYEDKFINYNTSITQIVNSFLIFINDLPFNKEDNELQIIDEVTKQAKALWNEAVKQNQHPSLTIMPNTTVVGLENITDTQQILDDRPLYWARNKMQTYLKRHSFFRNDIDFEKSLVKPNTKLAKIIALFEEQSRTYTGIVFSKTSKTKKILITGFDPFQLNSNIRQSNPSGIVALVLHNNTVLGADIQTMMFPVRYTDFDGDQSNNSGQGDGVVETYIGKVIGDVDAIITVSQSFPGAYNIDVFATATRGGLECNMNYIRDIKKKALSDTCPETIGTTLPKTFENSNAKYYGKYFETEEAKKGYTTYHYKDSTQNNKQFIDSTITSFENKEKTEYYKDKPIEYKKDKKQYDEFKGYKKQSNSQKDCDLTNFPKEYIFSGPGSNYLSNEIFYRVAKLREDFNKKLPTGHFHISKIQGGKDDLDTVKAEELLKIVKETLKEGFKGI